MFADGSAAIVTRRELFGSKPHANAGSRPRRPRRASAPSVLLRRETRRKDPGGMPGRSSVAERQPRRDRLFPPRCPGSTRHRRDRRGLGHRDAAVGEEREAFRMGEVVRDDRASLVSELDEAARLRLGDEPALRRPRRAPSAGRARGRARAARRDSRGSSSTSRPVGGRDGDAGAGPGLGEGDRARLPELRPARDDALRLAIPEHAAPRWRLAVARCAALAATIDGASGLVAVAAHVADRAAPEVDGRQAKVSATYSVSSARAMPPGRVRGLPTMVRTAPLLRSTS